MLEKNNNYKNIEELGAMREKKELEVSFKKN
jgi:hypothetical protein